MTMFRDLIEGFAFRERLANLAGKTFGGRRDLFKALGYKRNLEPSDYRSRYRRNEIANRIVKSFPKACWRGGAEIVEDHDPAVVTPFEQAFIDFDKRLKFWNVMFQADVLSRIGRYGVILIGAPGELDTPLEKAKPEEIAFLSAYPEEDARVQFYEVDRNNPRYGQPVFYQVRRASITAAGALNTADMGAKVHYSRIIHISEGRLEDKIFGEPALECVWNRLDDLEKVAGSGAEAFWRRADGGTQVDIDATMDVSDDDFADLKKQVEEWEHDLRKTLTTRGTKVNRLGSDVADIATTVNSLISLICAGVGIPQRVLMGSEQGKLAAKQDRASWDNQVTDRQRDYCDPMMVRPAVQRFIDLGVIPEPEEGPDEWEVMFSSIETMDDEQRAGIAVQWASLNKPNAPIIVLPDEIRGVLDLEPLDDVASAEDLARAQAAYNTNTEPTVAAGKRGAHRWQHIHKAADRFRAGAKARRLRSLREGPRGRQPRGAASSARRTR